MPARSTRLIASLVVLLAPGAIRADEPSPPALDAARQAFEAIDANRDGLLTREEAGDRRRLFERLLRRADKNSDGKLDLAEFTAGLNDEPNDGAPAPPAESDQPPRLRPQDAEALFRRMDANGDGRLTENDVPQPHRQRFSRLLRRADTDGDQALGIDEFKTAQGLVQRLFGENPDPAQPMPTGDPRFALFVFAALDSDGDGRLSAKEIEQAAENLKKLDRDGDGLVGPRELLGAPPQGAGPISPERLLQRLRRADADGDGKLKRDELPMFLQRRFERLDADGDGLADFNEIERALEAIIRRRGDLPNPSPPAPPAEQPPASGRP